MLSSALADAPQVEVAGVEALAEQDPCLRSPGGSGNCREYHLGKGCGVLAGSTGCHTAAQVEVYNSRCRESSRWGKACKCK